RLRGEPSGKPVASCQRFKSPRAASNLQFERPWDRFVPAKSVRKLIAPIIVSKKFLSYRRRKDCVQYSSLSSAQQAARTKGNSVEDSGHHSIRASANDIACFFSLPTCEKPHDHRDDDERYDTNPDIQRIDQTD